MRSASVASQAWKNMVIEYQKLGLSEKEIAERILCKTTRLIDRSGNLDKCDK